MPTKARTAAAKAKATTTTPKPKPTPSADPVPTLAYELLEPGELASNDDVVAVLGEAADGIPVAARILQAVSAGARVDEELASWNAELLAESGALAVEGLFYSRAPGEIAGV